MLLLVTFLRISYFKVTSEKKKKKEMVGKWVTKACIKLRKHCSDKLCSIFG